MSGRTSLVRCTVDRTFRSTIERLSFEFAVHEALAGASAGVERRCVELPTALSNLLIEYFDAVRGAQIHLNRPDIGIPFGQLGGRRVNTVIVGGNHKIKAVLRKLLGELEADTT